MTNSGWKDVPQQRHQHHHQHQHRASTHQQMGWMLVPLLILAIEVSMSLSSRSSGIGFPVTCVEALAAAKNKRKGRKSPGSGSGKGNGGFGGFGTPPPTLEDVLANAKNSRFPPNAPSLPCPCLISKTSDSIGDETEPSAIQNVKTYAECCGPLLDSTSSCGGCTTPVQVLQSRYTAFCYRNIGHVIRTTHEECRDYRDDKVAWAKDLDREGMFDSFEFVGLEIVDNDETTETKNRHQQQHQQQHQRGLPGI